MNVGYVHTFEVPENNIDKGRLKVSVVNEENVPIKGAAVRLSYTGNPDNIIGESGTDGDGISIFNDLRTPPIEYSMEPGNRQPFSEYDIAVSAPGFDNVNISGSDMFSGELSIQNVKMSARDNSQNNIVIPVNTLYGDYPPKIDEEEIKTHLLTNINKFYINNPLNQKFYKIDIDMDFKRELKKEGISTTINATYNFHLILIKS